MIEVVFHESAAGCLKLAQGYRRWKFRTSPACEEAVPFGGTAADIFAFHLMLSVGDIS